jgi:hypothetical protein
MFEKVTYKDQQTLLRFQRKCAETIHKRKRAALYLNRMSKKVSKQELL